MQGTITLEGYGQLKGQSETVKVGKVSGAQVILLFNEEGTDYETPFRLADGCVVGSSPEGGFKIPAEVLQELKESGKVTTKQGGTRPESSPRKAVRPASSLTPARAGKGNANMATATAEKPKTGRAAKTAAPAVKATVETTAAKNGKKTAEAPAPAPAATTRKRTPAPAAEEVKTSATKSGRIAASKPNTAQAATPAPKTRTKAQAAPAEEEEDGELSPMELAAQEGITRKTRRPGEGETEIKIAPLMFRQIRWNEIRPYPNGRRVPGFKEFKKAFDAAAERSYVYIVVNEAAARYLVETVFVNGFERNWVGSLAGGFKRGAKRTAEELAAEFGFKVPAVIANHRGSGARDEEEEAPAPPARGRRAAAAPAAPAAPVKATGRAKATTAPAAPAATARGKKTEPTPAPAAKKAVAKKAVKKTA
jgi:hypothetical protein